jgi:hypothetical protein
MRPIAIMLAVLCLSMSARAQEEVLDLNAVADAVAADVSEPAPVAETDLANGVIVVDIPFWWGKCCDAVASLLGIAWTGFWVVAIPWLAAKVLGADRAKVVKDAIRVNVDRTWDDMGRELKHAAKDRKLDADERQKLRNHCTTGVLTMLKGAARALFESYTESKKNAMISEAVEKRKAIASMSKDSTDGVVNKAA